jgi:hypothetical protein
MLDHDQRLIRGLMIKGLTASLIIVVYSFIKYTRMLVHFVHSRKLLLVLDMGKCTCNKHEKERQFIYNSSS